MWPDFGRYLRTGEVTGAAIGLLLAILIGVRRKIASSKAGLVNEEWA